MKTLLITFLLLTILSSQEKPADDLQKKEWKLIWEDNFEGTKLDTTKWTLINTKPSERASAWNRHMINDPRVYSVRDGSLYLTAIKNPGIENDPRPYLTGGVDSKGKFHFLYGKAEIRARKECAQGAWPALWMMPEAAFYGGWPHSGEIDIMEHLNFEGNIHYNVHTRYVDVVKNKTNPRSGSAATLADVTQWNVYGLEWYPDVLVWTLNGKETFRYPRLENSDPEQVQWPFDKSFYFILSQQLGGSWVGEVNPDQLPVSMIIDWVRVYQEK
jgi:beta-glucanase (GH16 family)